MRDSLAGETVKVSQGQTGTHKYVKIRRYSMPTDVAGIPANCVIGRMFQVACAKGLLMTVASASELSAANWALERLPMRSETSERKAVAALPTT